MSAIGFIMAGSCLEELYSAVYAKKSVRQMMNEKAHSRSNCALFLFEEALRFSGTQSRVRGARGFGALKIGPNKIFNGDYNVNRK